MQLLKMSGRVRESMTVELGGVAVDFVQCWLIDGRTGMVATIPENGLVNVTRQVRLMGTAGGYEIIKDNDGRIERAHGFAPTAQPAAPKPVPVDQLHRTVALRNGWSEGDLEGTGKNGESGKLGGFSPATGLTLADMTLCVPPAGWDELRDTKYPWDVERWLPPGIGFIAPQAPAKVLPQEEEIEPNERDLDPEVVGEVDTGEIIDPEAYKAALESGVIAEVSETPSPEAPAPKEKGPLSEYGDATTIKAAQIVIKDLIEKAGGTVPTIRKANYHLNKHDLPKSTADTLASLVETLT